MAMNSTGIAQRRLFDMKDQVNLSMDDVQMREVHPGIHLIKVPLPDNPLKELNSYFIEDADRPLLVDVGFNRPECEKALAKALSKMGCTFEDVDVLFTHSHPDHVGCIQRIWNEHMTLYANMGSFRDAYTIAQLQKLVYLPLMSVVFEDAHARRQSHAMTIPSEYLPFSVHLPITFLGDGDTISRGSHTFQVIETHGHDDHHICLYEPDCKVMIVGDHVLERITPNISSYLLETDKLSQFLSSLDKVRDYDVDLVLPGHAEPFTNLARRVDELKFHHAARLEEMVELVRGGHHDLIDITANATWKYPNWYNWAPAQKYFSMGETLAHLVHAVHQERLSMTICGTAVSFDLA